MGCCHFFPLTTKFAAVGRSWRFGLQNGSRGNTQEVEGSALQKHIKGWKYCIHWSLKDWKTWTPGARDGSIWNWKGNTGTFRLQRKMPTQSNKIVKFKILNNYFILSPTIGFKSMYNVSILGHIRSDMQYYATTISKTMQLARKKNPSYRYSWPDWLCISKCNFECYLTGGTVALSPHSEKVSVTLLGQTGNFAWSSRAHWENL